MQLHEILKNCPVDLSHVLQIAQVAKTDKMIIAGDENAAVLTLLDALGAGCAELAAVQQPCVVECVSGTEQVITLTNGTGSMRCSSLSDLGTRLGWEENRNATAQIVVNHSLFGWEKLVFAILDGENFDQQLSQTAAGATGAVIALNAFNAPSRPVYSYAKWLADDCALQASTAVMFYGPTDVLNTAPAMAIALQMGVPELPTITCNLQEQSLAEAMEQAVNAMKDKERYDVTGLEHTMAVQALKQLEAEKARLSSATQQPKALGLKLAERFAVEVPVARQQMEKLVTTEIANQIYSEMRDFAIYLQNNIVDLLVSGVEQLEEERKQAPKEEAGSPQDTKAALRAFTQSYLDSLLSDFSQKLVDGLMQNKLYPEAKAIYDQMFERAWLTNDNAAYLAMDEQEKQELHTTVGQLQQKGFLLLSMLIVQLIIYICPIRLPRRVIFGLANVTRTVVQETQAALTPVRTLAKTKGKQIADNLNTIIDSYQNMVTDIMIPQLRDGLLSWFDQQAASTLQTMKKYDETMKQQHQQATAQAKSNQELVEAIDRTIAQLQPWLA